MSVWIQKVWMGICSLVICAGCDQEAQLAEIPIFVTIPSVRVASGVNTLESHKISEIWTYADSSYIGAYPLPATIPIIANRDVIQLELFAGIRENGQSSSPIIYPFYTTVDLAIDRDDMQAAEIDAVFTYDDQVTVAFTENFENGNLFRVDIDGNDDSQMEVVGVSQLDGMAGRFTLTQDNREIAVASAFTLDQIPTNGSPVFLEIDFQSDVALAVGLRGSSPSVEPIDFYKIALFATDVRDKVYINFAADIQASGLSSFQIILRAIYDDNLPLDIQFVYMDNIKLLHF